MVRRICRLADSTHKDVDLRLYETEILETVERIVPGKHPRVERDSFSTDDMTLSEKVALGRALSKVKSLAAYGKVVSTFRLFDGHLDYSDENEDETEGHPKGGHMK